MRSNDFIKYSKWVLLIDMISTLKLKLINIKKFYIVI